MGRLVTVSLSRCHQQHQRRIDQQRHFNLFDDDDHVDVREEEAPFRLQLRPPFRFAIVEPGIYRGGYPRAQNHDFLDQLQLKTIISLVPESEKSLDENEEDEETAYNPVPLTEADAQIILQREQKQRKEKVNRNRYVHEENCLDAFCKERGIRRFKLPVDRPREHHLPLTIEQISTVLSLITNTENHPVYLHCLSGANMTGLIVMCLRHLQIWDPACITSEYLRFIRDGVVLDEEADLIQQFCSLSSQPISYAVNIAGKSDKHEPSAQVKEVETVDEIISKLQLISVTKTSATNVPEVELPSKLPPWLWNGTVPLTFVKSFVHASLTSASDLSTQQQQRDVVVNFTIQHPQVKCLLKPEHILHLMQVCLKLASEPNLSQNQSICSSLSTSDLNRWISIQQAARGILFQLTSVPSSDPTKSSMNTIMARNETSAASFHMQYQNRRRDLIRSSMEQKISRGNSEADEDVFSNETEGLSTDYHGEHTMESEYSREEIFLNQSMESGERSARTNSEQDDLSRTVEALALEGLLPK